MKKSVILTFVFIYFGIHLHGQNFLANADFEEFNTCQEFGSKCAPEAWFRIPPEDLRVAEKTDRTPFQGKLSEVLVVENINHPLSRRVFLYTKLLCPLLQGKEYQLSFYLKNPKLKDYNVQVLFTEEELISGIKNPLDFTPNLEFTIEQEASEGTDSGWKKVSTNFQATGKEVFMTMGYFSKKEIKATRKHTSNSKGDVIILIDNVELVPMDKNEKLCNDFETVKDKIYNQNYRHSNKISINHRPEDIQETDWNDNFFENPEKIDEEKKEKDKTVLEENSKPIFPNREWTEKDTLVFEIPFVAFDFDKTLIKEEFQSKLDSFALHIQYLNPKKVQFIGHTDSMGSPSYNQKLSTNRAKAVQAYMNRFEFFKIPNTEVIGQGESNPKASNKTMEGRQMNRRVEIIIFKNKDAE